MRITVRQPSGRLIRRGIQLIGGLFLYGVGIAFLVRGELGPAPWDVLTLGVMNHVPLTFGVITVCISGVVLLMWIPLRQKMGIGTIANALLIGPFADFTFLWLPEVNLLGWRIAFVLIGTVLIGAATGLYIGSRFGPGPRDGLMTGLHRVTGVPIWVTRTGIEIAVVATGWLLGGIAGLGTLFFALTIGPFCQFFMRLFDVPPPPSEVVAEALGQGN